MVNRPNLPPLLLAIAGIFFAINVSGRGLAEYQIGDRLEQDVIAPFQMSIVDPEATETLKQREAQRVPVVVRFHSGVADEVVAEFNRQFAQTQSNLLNSVERAFNRRVLSADDLASFRFQTLATLFERQNRLFPISTNRAALWASGDRDEAYQESLAATLRDVLKKPVRPDSLPAEPRLGNTIRIVTLQGPDDPLTGDNAERRGATTSRTNLVALAAARRDLQNLFLGDERAAGRFLATLLKPNCVIDAEVTRELRNRRTEGMASAVHFQAGEVVGKQGQVVDLTLKRALERIHERTTMGHLQTQVVEDRIRAARVQERMRWIIGASVSIVLLLGGVIWLLSRQRRPMSLLPAVMQPHGSSPDVQGGQSWEQRAIAAERTVENTREAVRAGIIAQLTRWMSSKFVQKLASQRTELLDSQQRAALEMAELEERLNRVQAPLQDRLTAYEKRIAELEKELAVKGEVNRELIKTKIVLARKQLEIEREKNRVEFN